MGADKRFLPGQNIPSRRHHTRVETRDGVWVYWNGKGREDTSHIIKGRPFGVGFECLAHSLQERNTLYD